MNGSAPDPHGQVGAIARRQSDGEASSTRAVVALARDRADRGRRRPWTEQQKVIDLKLQIVKQQEKLDALCLRLSRCETANEALRAEKAILNDQLALDREIIDALKRENQLLRWQQGKRPAGSDTCSTSYREIIDALRRENHLLRRQQGKWPASAGSETASSDTASSDTSSTNKSGRDDLVGIDLVCRPIDASQHSRSTFERTVSTLERTVSTFERTVGPSEETEANELISSAGERKAVAKLARRRSSATVPQRHFPFALDGDDKRPPSAEGGGKKSLPSLTEGANKEPAADEQTKCSLGSETASSTSEGASASEATPAKQDPPTKQDLITSQVTLLAPANQHKGVDTDYSLGDTLRSHYHMIVESTPKRAFESVDSLQKHDFAFVKRSDGSHSYAIVAGREYVEKRNGKTEVCMIFVMDSEGSTKAIRRRHWSQSVHLAKAEK